MSGSQDKLVEREKQLAAERSLDFVKNGMVLGLGTGSTIFYLISLLSQKIKDGFSIATVATSKQTEQLAKKMGIAVVDLSEVTTVDLTIDGADEIDEHLQLIKGNGGALLREKIVATNSKKNIIVADSRKQVKKLGKNKLPVEVIQFGWKQVMPRLEQLSCSAKLRMLDNEPFLTDEGNYIVDCQFGQISEPAKLAEELDHIVGVVEHGLFLDSTDMAIVGTGDTTITVTKRS